MVLMHLEHSVLNILCTCSIWMITLSIFQQLYEICMEYLRCKMEPVVERNRCLSLRQPAKTQLDCRHSRGHMTCGLSCRNRGQFLVQTPGTQNFTYTCGSSTGYNWQTAGGDAANLTSMPTCSGILFEFLLHLDVP